MTAVDRGKSSNTCAVTGLPCRGEKEGAKSHDFPLFPGTSGIPDGCGGSSFVSILHTGETVPAGSDPVSGKPETAFY